MTTNGAINWQPVFDEALEYFVNYLQIDTTNPPGNEKPAARWIGEILSSAGMEVEYVEIQPEREAVFGWLRGDGSKRAMMLCNHLDVVPVEEDYWTKPAFEGYIEDGKVYGRGAVDMKGCGIMHLMTMLMLQRRGDALKRDLVFCGVPDEEAGSVWGMEWAVQESARSRRCGV